MGDAVARGKEKGWGRGVCEVTAIHTTNGIRDPPRRGEKEIAQNEDGPGCKKGGR